MTNQFDELETVLAELRQRHRRLEAPAHLAVVLSTATYASQSQLRPRMRWRVWAIAAAVLIAVVAWRADRAALPGARRPLETRLAAAPESYPAAGKAAPAMSGASPAKIVAPKETMIGFVALPGSAGLPPPVDISVLQLRLRKGELRRYGFDIPPSSDAEFVRADFVIGDDGLARAVRFLR